MHRDHNADRLDWMRSVMDRYEVSLIRYAAHLTGNIETARDIVQDTFLRLCDEKKPESLNSHLPQWLFTVCRNRAFDIRRKESRMTSLTETDLSDHPSAEPSPADQAETRDAAGRVLDLLRSLPKHQQEVVRLKFQAGLSYKEIAEITDLSVTNVGFLLHTAIKTLRGHMQRIEGASHEA